MALRRLMAISHIRIATAAHGAHAVPQAGRRAPRLALGFAGHSSTMMIPSSWTAATRLTLLLPLLHTWSSPLSPPALVVASGFVPAALVAPCPAAFPPEMCLGSGSSVRRRAAAIPVVQKPPMPRPNITLPFLRQLLQQAIEVEHSTIPLYLTALYSIVDSGSFAAQAVRGVVIEEMLHMTAAANVLNA
eukprot:COSAG01_NODE_2368_length_7814_cov_83.159819_5_plen_189_part_00